MKPKADGWLFAVAVIAVAAVLFLPLPPLHPPLLSLRGLKPAELAPVLTWFLAAGGFWLFRVRFWPIDARERRRFSSAVLLVLLQSLLFRAAFEFAWVWKPTEVAWLPTSVWIWIPWFLIPGLSGILLEGRFGVLLCLTGTVMFYLLAHPGPWPLMGSLASGLGGVLFLRRAPTRSRVLRAGAVSGAIFGVVGVTYDAMQGRELVPIAAVMLICLLIGLFTAFLVLALLPLLEWILEELSDVSVIEYGTDHPLLDELRSKAPGTWHHSLNVADLAEKAAAQIGARALFCKTSALYHDIGKLKEPALFAENNDGSSPHDQLEPLVSAQKIIEHVSYGLELARKHKLPKAFREIIAEHHGVSVVRFFYAKACQLLPEASRPKVDRAQFCYPGPPPSTRESGIIALADAVEAASRSVSLRSETDLRAFVRSLFADRITEGELACCPLTLAELAKIEAAFVGWLKGRNQFRPAYPATSVGQLGAEQGQSAPQTA